MKRQTLFLILTLTFISSFHLFAQNDNSNIDLKLTNQKRLSLQKKTMYVLGGWAVGNFAYSGTALAIGVENSENRYFHQFNIYWNTVNLGLATGSLLLGNKNTDLNYPQTLKAYHSTESLFLLNTGIDVGYIATGFYLRERAKNQTENKAMLQGYGKSLILQGGFLFAFDLAAYFLTKAQSKKLYEMPVSLSMSGNGFRLRYRF